MGCARRIVPHASSVAPGCRGSRATKAPLQAAVRRLVPDGSTIVTVRPCGPSSRRDPRRASPAGGSSRWGCSGRGPTIVDACVDASPARASSSARTRDCPRQPAIRPAPPDNRGAQGRRARGCHAAQSGWSQPTHSLTPVVTDDAPPGTARGPSHERSRAVRARSHHTLTAWPASRSPAASRPRRCRPASHCRQHGPLDRGRGCMGRSETWRTGEARLEEAASRCRPIGGDRRPGSDGGER